MNNILVFPVVLPLITGVILIFLRPFIHLQRWMTFGVMAVNTGISMYLLQKIQNEGILRLDFGGWEPPFGILFVGDSFSLLLVLTTSIVSAIILLYAFHSLDAEREKMYFYPFVNFLVAGVIGSFLTGDLFNLFVFFEVMLLSSYALVSLGGTKIQLKEGIIYLAINVISSWLFLIAIAYLYGTVGTLNLAHISQRIAESGQTPILTVISIIFLMVFSLKAGLVLYHWLPGSYSAPPAVIGAMFGALLTKVGIYALYRMFTLVFYHEPEITHTLIGIMAGLTLIGGSVGAIAYNDIRKVITYNVVIAVGFILVGLAVLTPAAVEGSIIYLVHDMVIKALLFLIGGTMIALTGTARIENMSGLIRNYPSLGWIFFITMLSLAGIPPFSGFVGKVLVGQGAAETGSYLLLGLAFLSSLAVLYSLLRIFLNAFWGETIISEEDELPLKRGRLIPLVILAIGTIVLGLGMEYITVYASQAAEVLLNPDIYIDAVMNNN
jgi:multicomponent Na+:H+ antiporter subunit D